MTRFAAPIVFAMLLSAWPVLAEEASAAEPAPASSDPAAVAILDAALDAIEDADRLSVEASLDYRVRFNGQKQEEVSSVAFVMAGPNRFALRPAGNRELGFELVSDGQTLWTHHPGEGRYTEAPAPAGTAEVPAKLYGDNPYLIALMNPAGTRRVMHKAVATVVGREELHGRAADRVRVRVTADALGLLGFPQPGDLTMDVWVSAEPPRRVLQFIPDVQAMIDRAEPGMFPEGLEMSIVAGFHDWAAPESFPEGTFSFDPGDAEQVEDLFDRGGGPDPADVLVGEPAPAFELPALAGPAVSLADLKGRIVVLDFWATWCPPCVAGLPKMSGTAAGYADRGVVFYAVNQQEPAEVIRAFLKDHKLESLNVLLDGGDTAEAYHVGGIPQTVVIDRAGVVRAVHVGYGPGGEKQLAGDLEAILEADAPKVN